MLLPSAIPGRLGIRGGTSSLFTNGGVAYNYAIGGLPFLSAASNLEGGRWWIRRETAPFRKQQFDSAQNPGEQSLDGYWIRSVMSFHGGAGQLYADPVEGNTSSDIRFRSSKGVSVWTPGSLSLLFTTYDAFDYTGVTAPGPVDLLSVKYGTDPGVVSASPSAIVQFNVNPSVFAHSQVWPSTILSACTDGARVFVHATDGVYRGPLGASAINPIVFTKIYTNTATSGKIAWVKDRIVLGSDSKIYELSPDPAGPPAALPTALYTAKASGWVWTDITETTAAIYAVGASNNVSAVLKFTLDTSGDLPTLTGGTIACQLPGGETAIAALGYLGTYLALGTSKGARIAVADDQGNLTYGPLLWENQTPVYDFAARDHWIWATYLDESDTEIKVARIDLGLQIEPLRFAWATDLIVEDDADSSDCTELCFAGDSDCLILGTTNSVWIEANLDDGVLIPRYVDSGFLETSRIRFNTLEPKIFRNVRIRGPELQGTLSVAYISPSGSVTPVFTFGVGDTPGTDDVGLTGDARDFLALKFTLSAGESNNSATAEMSGWQVKALPGSPRQRMITLPLYCFDWESDHNGVRTGGQGFAWSRLTALETAEAQGNILTFQDLDNDVEYDVFIESLEFQQGSPPAHFKEPGSFGGRILLTMRTV